jgi:hypothetical protein
VVVAPLSDIRDEACRVIAAADARRLRARLLGGLGVAIHSRKGPPPGVRRVYGDIDLVLRRADARPSQELMPQLGYTANSRFNALHGGQRLMFFDEANERRVDVFVGSFAMCHQLDLESALPEFGATLSLADLLLTKLQIVEINEKDLADVTMLLRDHEVGELDDPEVVDVRRIRDVCRADWGWFTTVDDNLQRLPAAAGQWLQGTEAEDVSTRAARIREDIAAAKKSMRWKARARIGRKVAWYELPEET